MDYSAILVGFGVGTLATSAVAWGMLRRRLSRIRLAERRARQAERMAEIGSMTGGLAHEIKNPLSTIGLNAQLLVEGIEETDVPEAEKSRLLNRTRALQRETERLRGILQDFLDFAGQVHLERRPVNLNELVGELADFYLPEAERQGVSIRSELAPGSIRASVDPRAVKQAVLNLMLNATQAMAQDGSGRPRTLTLRTRLEKDEGDRGRIAAIHVVDTGPGMSPETKAQLFKPYFTTKSGGTGLGLATSRRLIDEHGGRITVDTEPGRGSDFTVILPLDAPAS